MEAVVAFEHTVSARRKAHGALLVPLELEAYFGKVFRSRPDASQYECYPGQHQNKRSDLNQHEAYDGDYSEQSTENHRIWMGLYLKLFSEKKSTVNVKAVEKNI
jgi:hypothetical protein